MQSFFMRIVIILLLSLLFKYRIIVQGLGLSGAEFDQSCRSALMRFLDRYSSLEKSFNQDHLKKVVLIEKEFFKSQTPDESQKLFVEWQVANYQVQIAGVKEDVNAKIQEIIEFLENVLPKYDLI